MTKKEPIKMVPKPDAEGEPVGKAEIKPGLCRVLKANFFMPNGKTPMVGDTFDPTEVKMSLGRYRSLVAGKYITEAGKPIEDKMLKEWNTKSGC